MRDRWSASGDSKHEGDKIPPMTSLKRFLLAVLITTAAAVTAAQDRAPRCPASTSPAWTCRCGRRTISSATSTANGPTPRRFRRTSGYGTFAMLRDRARRPCAASSRRKRGEGGAGSIGQKVGDFYKSFMDEARIEGARDHAARRRARGDREDQRKAGSAGRVRPSGADRRPAAVLGQRRHGPAQLRGLRGVRSRSRASACPIAITTCGTTRSSARSARPMRPTSRGSSRSATSPIPKAPPAASSRSRPKLAKLQWDRARNRDRNATYNKMGVDALQASTPHFDWSAYLAALAAGGEGQGHEVIVRQPDYMKASTAASMTPRSRPGRSTWRSA